MWQIGIDGREASSIRFDTNKTAQAPEALPRNAALKLAGQASVESVRQQTCIVPLQCKRNDKDLRTALGQQFPFLVAKSFVRRAKSEETDVPSSSSELTPSSASEVEPKEDEVAVREETPSVKKTLKSVNEKSVHAFVSRIRGHHYLGVGKKWGDSSNSRLDDWKRYHQIPLETKIYSISGGYADFQNALDRRGWIENPEPESYCFDLRWCLRANQIDFELLSDHQLVNHFSQGEKIITKENKITTKIGLTQNLRSSIDGVESDSFYPRSFDMRCPMDRGDFFLDYIITKAQSVVVNFHKACQEGSEVALTYPVDVIRIGITICKRLIQDIDDVIDNPSLADKAWSILPDEWELLKHVSLDDPSVWLDEDPENFVMDYLLQLKITHGLITLKETKRKNPTTIPKLDDKKKKKAPVPLSVPSFVKDTNIGKHLAREANWIIHELEKQEKGGRNAWTSLQSGKNAWIIKPAGQSRGRGIQMMRNLSKIRKTTEYSEGQWICQKYIENPQLICGYKFDIRQWVLVTDLNPLTVYIWNQPYIRFAGEKYDGGLQNDSCLMHLVNNSVVKNAKNFDEYNSDIDATGYMWHFQQYQKWLHDSYCQNEEHHTPFIHEPKYTCVNGVGRFTATHQCESRSETEHAVNAAEDVTTAPIHCPDKCGPEIETETTPCEDRWKKSLVPQMEEIILASLTSIQGDVKHRKNSFEIYGYDFMVSGEGDCKVWLIEVNSSPAMDYSTAVTTPLVKQVMEETARVVVDNKPETSPEWRKLRVGQRIPLPAQLPIRHMDIIGERCVIEKKKLPVKKKKKRDEEEVVVFPAEQEPSVIDSEKLTEKKKKKLTKKKKKKKIIICA